MKEKNVWSEAITYTQNDKIYHYKLVEELSNFFENPNNLILFYSGHGMSNTGDWGITSNTNELIEISFENIY